MRIKQLKEATDRKIKKDRETRIAVATYDMNGKNLRLGQSGEPITKSLMVYCGTCGQVVSMFAKVCPNCGSELKTLLMPSFEEK